MSVVTVEPNGTARAIGAGTATIMAAFQGAQGTATLRALPRHAGSWTGQWEHAAFESVSSSGCADVILGSKSVLELTLTQNRTTVAGTLNLAGIRMDVTGSIAVDGTLSIAGERADDRQGVQLAHDD